MGNGVFIKGARVSTEFNRAVTWIQKSEETVGCLLTIVVVEILNYLLDSAAWLYLQLFIPKHSSLVEKFRSPVAHNGR